jgi:hypothetical protein
MLIYESGKMRQVEDLSGTGRGLKENDGQGEFNYGIYLRTFVNVTMYPLPSTTIT